MKKLLSICFLSILLGLFSFGVRAQSGDGCKSGFWIENLQPDTVYGVVNMPPDGKLPLSHTLGHFLNGSTVLPGNVTTIGNTELYELHFCNTCGLDPKTKVSIDWVLLRKNQNGEWEEVNDNLFSYADFGIYTFYNQLNQSGECQSIMWEGGRVPDEHGYCENQGIGTGIPLLDDIYGNCNPQGSPTNYPGAMHVAQGTPMAVPTALGNILPAAGLVSLYSQNHDYFYLDFFEQTRNIVVIKWKQVGDYKLVMRVRQRLGGTPWTNEYWKWENGVLSQTDYVGGHQSCCGPVLVEDTIGRPEFGEFLKEVCADANAVDPFRYGRPLYTFTVSMPDTNVVFGEYRGVDPSACHYFHTDSVNRLHFFVRENPQVQAQDIAICKCTQFGQNELNALVTLADTANKGVVGVRLEWATSATATNWSSTIPTPPTAVGVYHFFVRQVNIYQTIECVGDPAEITLTINEIPAPTGGLYEICNESTQTTMTLTVNRNSDVNNCSTTSVWFLNGEAVHTGDTYNVTLADIRPATNIDQDVVYHVRAYNATTDCYSAAYSVVTVRFHQTPEIQLTYADTICPRPDNVYFTMVVTSNQTEFPYTVNQYSDFDANDNAQLTSPNNQQVTNYHKPYTKITDFECDGVYHLYYKVTDANGCYVRDTATFIAKDIVPPTVEPATWTVTVNQCNFEGANRPDTIKTMSGFDGLTTISDDCGIDHFTYKDSTYAADDTCENVLVRTYTFYDYCNNAATFTQTFTAHDLTAPHFVGTPNRPIYERLQPKRGENCTFNSLSKAEFVMAFLGKVQDNCVEYDSAYLYDHSEFYWEESSHFGHVLAYETPDIFRDMVGNQLTVEIYVWDGCHNVSDTLAFWFEPDTLIVPNVTVDPVICLGDTAFLSFDSTLVDFGYHFELAHPLTFQWGSQEAESIINFGNTGEVNTYVVPTAGGVYHVNMTVTDAYGCSNSSEYAEVEVHAAPDIVIIPHENNVCQPGYTYIPGQHIIWHGSYSPNVGIVWLAARDASNPSLTIPNLTYQWTTSQSVNILSTQDTTGLWIVPDSCTYTYDAQVMVTDQYGCTAVDSIWVPVKDTVPEYTGGIHHDIRPLEEQCRMTVGDFTHYVESNLTYYCGHWPPKVIWQEPAADEELTQDTDVTVYVVSQCGEDTLVIGNGTFRALVYPDRIHVRASVQPREACDPATFEFSATDSLAIGNVDYFWTKGVDTVARTYAFTNIDTVEAGASSSVYVYQVTAIDAVNCVATDTVSVTVHETLPIPEYEVFPNTRCVELYNGLIRLKNMPKGYSYKLYYEEEMTNLLDSIITQIPAFDDTVPTTSIIFDELAGNHEYWVLIITDFGCETLFPVYVDEVITYPVFHGEVTTDPTTYCTENGNGKINIAAEPGYTYYVFDANGNEILYPYQNLSAGDYTVVKENDTTECSTPTTVTINSTAGFTFSVTANANTHCVAPFNGKLTFTKANVVFVVTDVTEGEVIYTGPSTTLTGLHAGQYSVFGTDTITGCTKTVNKNVTNNTQNPAFTVTVSPNQYCDNEFNIVNGSLVPNVTSYTYQYEMLVGNVWETVTDNTHLAAGHYRVTATNASGCTTSHVYDIVDNVEAPEIHDSTVVNTICDTAVAPTHSYDGKVILTITNYDADLSYTVTLGENTVVAESAVVEFVGLNAGIYNYTVVDNFYCEYEGEVEVGQQELQALVLKQTPNTYCVGTYNKPGNGTITVMAPYDEVQYYYYSYYYAPVGLLEKGDDVEVDYDNLINRFYWLVDTSYYVEVLDLRTGCITADTITVQLGRDNVLLTGDPTPNVNCIAPFNGEIQLHTNYIPAEFDYSHLPLEPVNIPEVLYPRNRFYKYSIDGGLTYQYDSLFTNLEDGVYYFTVYDTISGCVYNDFDSIVVEKAENDIAIEAEISANHACVDSLYDGVMTVTATSTTFPNAGFVFTLVLGDDTIATSDVNPTTWTSLAPGAYTVIALDTVSGCEKPEPVEITTENECVPEITVDTRKFCLNEENASLTAIATLPEDCADSGFTYRWRKECHHQYFDGATVPVATDVEMCCFYTVTATSVATGCYNVKQVEVCVYPTHPIIYTVDHEAIAGNEFTNCENEDRWIGIVPDPWVSAQWTMNHTTDMDNVPETWPEGMPYEYEFYVNVPDSIAKYDTIAIDPTPWRLNKRISFCVSVVDTHGCPATGTFNLINIPLVRETVNIEVCDIFSQDPALDDVNYQRMMEAIGEADFAALYAGTAVYPYTVNFSDTIEREVGCDSIVTYNITILGVPTIDAPQEVASYCYGKTLSEIMENVTISNAADTTYTVNGDMVEDMNYVFAYSVDPVSLIITCSSGNADCAAEQEITFYVDSIPEFTGELVIDELCAGSEIEVEIPMYNCNQHEDACTVDVILVDSTDAENVVVTTLAENIPTEDPYLLDPIKMSYNGKYFGFIVKNVCGFDTILTQLVVDTIPEGTVSVDAICANQTLTTSWEITNGVDRTEVTATAYVKMAGETEYVVFDPTTTVDYSYNGASLYYVLANDCGEYTTPATTIVVSDKPTIVLNPDPLMSCVSEFDALFKENYCGNTVTGEPLILGTASPIPDADETGYVLPNGSAITEHGWLLVVENVGAEDTYEAITAAQIKELAKDTIIRIKYYAGNACGYDTVGAFEIGLSDAPEVTVNVNGTMCRTSMVSDVVSHEVVWHSATGTEGEVIYKVFAEGEEITETGGYVIVPETTPFEHILSYNGGKLLVIAVSAEGCGNDTADVDLNIPTWTPTTPVMQAACRGSQFSYFIATAPTIVINNATVASESWYVVNATTEDTEIALNTVVNSSPIEVYYKWVTSCGDVITTDPIALDILDKPTVAIDDITICAGNTVDLAEAHLFVTDPSNVVSGDPTWTINGEAYSATATYGAEYDNTNIVVTVPSDCGSVQATATLHVNTAPEITLTAPENGCDDDVPDVFTATEGFASYTFTLDGGAPVEQASNEFSAILHVTEGETGTTVHTVTVTAVDENGCVTSEAGSASVVISNSVGFIFTDMSGNVTNDFTTSTGEGLQYIWKVNDECLKNDTLVWVEYEFYRNGVALTNRSPYDNHTPLTASHIENYISTVTVGAGGASSFIWNTKNEMDFQVLNPGGSVTPMHDESYYFGASGYSAEDFPSANNYYGNHFPYSNLSFLTTTNYYDDLWMHFLAQRPVTQTIAPFLSGGEYTVIFKLYATTYRDNWQNPHADQAEGWSIAENTISPRAIDPNGGILIGGHWYAKGTPTLLAVDSIHISVDGPDYEPETLPGAPELSPNLTVDETEIAPDMEVWPNPAPAITTTLKARVHNMSGEATVTLNTLSGTQVYSGKAYLTNENPDGDYFQFDVVNLNVGTYILTVRTSDAIITKKVIVTSLAH